jgi:hypothetical protein
MIESMAELDHLLCTGGPEAQARLRSEPISKDVIREAVSHEDEGLRIAVVSNKATVPDDLMLFRTDPSSRVRDSVAMRHAAGEETLRMLAADVDESVRCRVAHNKKCPLDVLLKLSTDPIELVRNAAHESISRHHAE